MDQNMETEEETTKTIQARFISDTGEEAGQPVDLPVGVTKIQLTLICNALLQNVCRDYKNLLKSNLIN